MKLYRAHWEDGAGSWMFTKSEATKEFDGTPLKWTVITIDKMDFAENIRRMMNGIDDSNRLIGKAETINGK